MPDASMRDFWDERAREDAAYFVDSRQQYGSPDLDHLFDEGARNLRVFFERMEVALGPDDVVVEIGCGIGRLTRAMAPAVARVVALDISEEMLGRARELSPELANVDWRLGDGTSLGGVEDASADACVSVVVFQHLPNAELTLDYVREIGRVLRPGGWAAIQFSNDPAVHRRRLLAPGRLRALLGRAPRGSDNRAWLGSWVGLDNLREAAAESGLEVEKVSGEGTLFCCVRLRKAE